MEKKAKKEVGATKIAAAGLYPPVWSAGIALIEAGKRMIQQRRRRCKGTEEKEVHEVGTTQAGNRRGRLPSHELKYGEYACYMLHTDTAHLGCWKVCCHENVTEVQAKVNQQTEKAEIECKRREAEQKQQKYTYSQ